MSDEAHIKNIKGMLDSAIEYGKKLGKNQDEQIMFIALLLILSGPAGASILTQRPALLEKLIACVVHTLASTVPMNKLVKILDYQTHSKL